MSDDIDWHDLCDLGARLRDSAPDSRDTDLLGQGLTAKQIRTMQDITPTGEWL